jgi:NADH dehydrogenase/NADH:ubiquinone oxidoreductase subunit G
MSAYFSRKITIDGKKVKTRGAMTILEAAHSIGIEIPTLCHLQGYSPTGVCRVCVVEVAGSRTLMGACHTPVSEGMVVQTHTPKVVAARKVLVELMLTSHTGDCVTDANAENCTLHNLASDHEVGAPRFNVKAPRFYPAEEDNPYVKRNLSKCILCRKCVRVCRDMAGKNILSIGYRGFRSKVVAGFDEPLTSESCRNCGVCVEYCPTGALSAASGLIGKTKVQTGGTGK